MMFAAESVVTTLQDYFVSAGLYTIPAKADAYAEIKLANLAHQHWDEIQTALAGKIDGLMNIDFSFLGLNLGDQPKWNFFFNTDWSDTSVWLPALGLFLIPIISAFLSWASMKISNAINPTPSAGAAGDQAAATMKSMNIVMPLMSIWICFVMPAAMGIYWIANSVFGIIRDYTLTKVYKKKLDEEDKIRQAARSAREKELEAKRLETERLRAEGKTEKNVNTSKKKIQASEKVGNRRYARGRAYVEDRFEHPETAEEATIAAAAESEGAASIDETVAEEVLVSEDTALQAEQNTEAEAEAAVEETPAEEPAEDKEE